MNRSPDVLDRLAQLFEPPGHGFEDLVLRREKRERARRMGAIALVTVIALTFVIVAISTVGSRKSQPADFDRIHGWIVYHSKTSDLVAVDPADPTHRVSLGYAAQIQPIGWSRDGSRLLGRKVVSGPIATLYVVSSSGTKVPVTPYGDATWGSISPDGTRVVYANPGDRGLYTTDALGGEPTLILRFDPEPFTIEWPPAWSPDGSRIAVLDKVGSRGDVYGLIVVNPDGSGRVVKIDDPGAGNRTDPIYGPPGGLVWSPDGSRLAFFDSTDPHGSARIYVVDTQTWTVQQVTNAGDSRWPSWSPDGSRIAFVRDDQLYTMRADGGDVQRVDGVELSPNTSIAWNPG